MGWSGPRLSESCDEQWLRDTLAALRPAGGVPASVEKKKYSSVIFQTLSAGLFLLTFLGHDSAGLLTDARPSLGAPSAVRMPLSGSQRDHSRAVLKVINIVDGLHLHRARP